MHLGHGPTITLIELETQAEVPDLTEEALRERREAAKRNCPVSKALAGPEIRMRATLV